MAFDLSSVGAPIDERYPNDLALQAIGLMEGARPGLVMRNGSPETVLVEGLALAAADVANSANQSMAEVAELLLSNFFQVPRRPGASAVGEVTVTFDSTVSTTIPAGTGFRLTEYGVEVATTAETTVSAVLSVVLQVATVTPTTLVNGVGPGAGVDILDVIPNALSVAVTAAFAQGQDPESDSEYIVRARNFLPTLTRALGPPDTCSAFVLLDGRASNASAIGAWDGTGSAPTSVLGGTDGGHVAVVTYGRGANLSADVRAELEAAMTPRLVTGVTVHVVAAAVTTVNVTVSVKAMPGFASAEVSSAVGDVVRGFLAPESWVIGADVVRNQLQDRITSLPQVDYVVALSAPAADVVVPVNGVVAAGAVSVSVT